MQLLLGDCLEVMKTLPDNSVDSIVTDPPYELGFMGKSWDNTGIANNVDMWKECLRVLKPGGHLLSFGGTRTYHRMACAIEDAGFEVRDMIEWCYGSGFPKSLNIGKAVDKLQGNEREVLPPKTFPDGSKDRKTANHKFYADVDSQENNFTNSKGTSEWEGRGTGLKPAHESVCLAQKPLAFCSVFSILVSNHLLLIKKTICQSLLYAKTVEQTFKSLQKEGKIEEKLSIAQWVVEENINIQVDLYALIDMLQSVLIENMNLNIVLGWLLIFEEVLKQKNMYTTGIELNLITDLKILNSFEYENIYQSIILAGDSKTDELNVNVYTVDVLLRGVLLKLRGIQDLSVKENVMLSEATNSLEGIEATPKHEPICMARKPLGESTVASNVLKYGTGGINIDESRVETSDKYSYPNGAGGNSFSVGEEPDGKRTEPVESNSLGRFPANLILGADEDGQVHEEVRECFPETKSGSGNKSNRNSISGFGGGAEYDDIRQGDSGNASRFFKSIIYQAKSSKSERNRGLDSHILITILGTVLSPNQNLQCIEKHDQDQIHLLDIEVCPQKEGSECEIKIRKGKDLNISLFEKITTDQYLNECKSTISTTTDSTMTLRILNWLRHCITKEYIADANGGIEFGENLVENAEGGKILKTTIKGNLEFLLDAKTVVSEMQLIIKERENKNFHSTVKPIALLEYLINMVTQKGGTVLDPFMGSGSTGCACKNLDRSFIGIEKDADYFEIAKKRLAKEEDNNIEI